MVDADRRAALRDITSALRERMWEMPPSSSLLRLIEMRTAALLLLLFSIDIEFKRGESKEEPGWWWWLGGRWQVVCCVRPAQKNWGGYKGRRIIASFWMWQEHVRALAAWPRAAKSLTPWLLYISFHRPFPSHLLLVVLRLVWVKVQPMISYKYLMTVAVGRLLSSLLHVHDDDDDDDGRNPLNASPSSFQIFFFFFFFFFFIIKCTHSICPGPGRSCSCTAHSSDNKDARWMDWQWQYWNFIYRL